MNHPCQTDRDINLRIVPEDQITGLRVLSLRWKLLKRIVFIEVIRCKDNIAILCIILGNFFFIAKKVGIIKRNEGNSNFYVLRHLDDGGCVVFRVEKLHSYRSMMGYRSGNQNRRKNADIGQPWGLVLLPILGIPYTERISGDLPLQENSQVFSLVGTRRACTGCLLPDSGWERS